MNRARGRVGWSGRGFGFQASGEWPVSSLLRYSERRPTFWAAVGRGAKVVIATRAMSETAALGAITPALPHGHTPGSNDSCRDTNRPDCNDPPDRVVAGEETVPPDNRQGHGIRGDPTRQPHARPTDGFQPHVSIVVRPPANDVSPRRRRGRGEDWGEVLRVPSARQVARGPTIGIAPLCHAAGVNSRSAKDE
jgi:hypothetical protein